MKHYVYEIENIRTGIKYIGVRSSKVDPMEDKYMSSSKSLKALVNKSPEDFKKTILCTFVTRERALAFEVFLHNYFDVAKNPLYYNKAKQTSKKFNCVKYGKDNTNYGKGTMLGRIFTEEHRSNISKSKLGKTREKWIIEKLQQGKKERFGNSGPAYKAEVSIQIIQQLLREGKTKIEVAKHLGCALSTVYNRLKTHI